MNYCGANILSGMQGQISVEGHSDDVPIQTIMFPSNWDLSAQRALVVAHGLLDSGVLDSKRISVSGFADSKPLMPNDSAINRAKNRRVELVLEEKSADLMRKEIQELKNLGKLENIVGDDIQNEMRELDSDIRSATDLSSPKGES